MKYAIPLAALVLLGLAAAVNSGIAVPAEAPRQASLRGEPPSPSPESGSRKASVDSDRVETPVAAKREQGIPVAAAPKAEVPPWRKMLLVLSRDLALTSVQEGSVEQILRLRTEEIRICHEEIRKARLLDMRRYEWQVADMKASWYRRIDSLLDSSQHQRFVVLVEQGLFNEGLGITEDPGMTVLD